MAASAGVIRAIADCRSRAMRRPAPPPCALRLGQKFRPSNIGRRLCCARALRNQVVSVSSPLIKIDAHHK